MENKEVSNFAKQGADQVSKLLAAIPPADKGEVERVVKAGGKVMFSKETHKYMQTILADEGDMADNLGIGIVQLMMLLHGQSKGNIPLKAWAPAASILLVHAMEFVDKTEGGMTMEIYGEALKVMIFGLKKKVEEIMQKSKQQGRPEQAGAQPPAQQSGGLMSAQPQGV